MCELGERNVWKYDPDASNARLSGHSQGSATLQAFPLQEFSLVFELTLPPTDDYDRDGNYCNDAESDDVEKDDEKTENPYGD